MWLTNDSITSFPSELLSSHICNKTSRSSGISEFSSSFRKCKTWVMSSSDWPGAIASANLWSSFYCNLSNFWCHFCFVLSFRSLIFFCLIWYARGLEAVVVHKELPVAAAFSINFLGNLLFLEYIHYLLVDWRFLEFGLPVNDHGYLLAQSQFSKVENSKLNLLAVID